MGYLPLKRSARDARTLQSKGRASQAHVDAYIKLYSLRETPCGFSKLLFCTCVINPTGGSAWPPLSQSDPPNQPSSVHGRAMRDKQHQRLTSRGNCHAAKNIRHCTSISPTNTLHISQDNQHRYLHGGRRMTHPLEGMWTTLVAYIAYISIRNPHCTNSCRDLGGNLHIREHDDHHMRRNWRSPHVHLGARISCPPQRNIKVSEAHMQPLGKQGFEVLYAEPQKLAMFLLSP